MEKITVIVNIEAISGKEDEVKKILMEMIEPTRKEPGCISYRMLCSQSDPCEFAFIEEWEKDEDMNTHLLSGHFNTTAGKLEGMLVSTPNFRQYELCM